MDDGGKEEGPSAALVLLASLAAVACSVGMLACPVVALVASTRGDWEAAAGWLVVAFALYFAGRMLQGVIGRPEPPTEAELAEKEQRLEEARERLEERRVEQAMGKRDKALRKAGLKCPRCGSEDVALVGDTGSPLSAGKAIVGGAIAGPAGAAVGAMLGKRSHREYVCLSCGHRYEAR